jgi:formylglycine-generating enzyme required for sulfatase activity
VKKEKTMKKSILILLIAVSAIVLVSFIRKGIKNDNAIPDSQIKNIAENNISDHSGINNKRASNSLGMELVRITPGNFIMGDKNGNYDEQPEHWVNITESFYMSTTPVTNAQYEQFDADHKLLRGKREISKGDDEAVVFVSWYEANAFTEWLSQKEGKSYRLPTEAEWEYACRAGTATPFHTGDSLPAIYHLNQENKMFIVPVDLSVGKTPPNQWGLYNMHGLVEEWCLDWYGYYPEGTRSDPVGYAGGDFKVTRGGSHNTSVSFLRSSNRSGMIPEDKNYLVGFRVVIGDMPATEPEHLTEEKQWAKNVSQKVYKWEPQINMEEPYFESPVYFQNVPPGSNGPLYSTHNHCPDITSLPNGDLFATWYTTNNEEGRELTVAAARLRKGESQWDAPDVFYKVPDRNMHATSIWWDKEGNRIYHFQGVAGSYGWVNLALFMRTSEDNGKTWSKPHWINHEHGPHNMPIAGVIKTSEGSIVVPCDAVVGGEREVGSAIHISKDNGITWYDPGAGSPVPTHEEGGSGGTIAGIHAGVVDLKDGRLLAFGRGNNINGNMPMSISDDMGKTWRYKASPFPPISSGQRLALIRLAEGPLFFASFTGPSLWWGNAVNNDNGMEFTDKDGNSFRGYGLFFALSYDEGKTWPVRKLLTPGTGEYDGGAWTKTFKTDATHAEPRGYMAATQSPDKVIHLISSKIHYRFNLAWLEQNVAYKTIQK